MNIVACILLFMMFPHDPMIHQQERYRISGEIQLTEMNGTVYLSLIDKRHFDEPHRKPSTKRHRSAHFGSAQMGTPGRDWRNTGAGLDHGMV